MPFQSEKQRRYLHAKHPKIARRWEKEEKQKMSGDVEWLTEADIVGKTDWSDVSFCNCCSPMELSLAVLKAKRKSKPFHGYNKKKHARTGGLSAKGRAHFKRKTGANLKRPVTKKPSKLKRGGKAAKRRKSFCARMSGVKGPTSKGGKLTPKGAALKRWNC